jgi:integral membrane protein
VTAPSTSAPLSSAQAHAGTRRAFRAVAIAEAFSWAGLLVGMFFKWILETTEIGVKIFGPIHGGIFVAYLVMCLVAWRRFGWSFPVAVAALASSIPPFFTVVFETWADRRGLLGTAARR